MATLTELNEAIIAYDNLWPLLEGDERDVILEKRNELNDQASELATKILRDGVPELNEVIDKLNLATQAAKEAKDSIDNKVKRIIKVANAIEKGTSAIGKIAKVIAMV